MKLQLSGTASYPGMVYLPANEAVTYAPGQCLTVASGMAAVASGATMPTHICYGEAKDGLVPAIRITDAETYAAPLSVAGSALAVGNKVTLAADGIRVTATTASGVAEIVGFATEAKAAGDYVFVKF